MENDREREEQVEAVITEKLAEELREKTGANAVLVIGFIDGDTCGRPGAMEVVARMSAPCHMVPHVAMALPKLGADILIDGLRGHAQHHSDDKSDALPEDKKALPPSLDAILSQALKKGNRKGV